MRATLVLAFCIIVPGCVGSPTNPTRTDSGAGGLSVGTATTDVRIDTSIGHGGTGLSATLTGAAEIPGPGDPDGTGTAEVTLNPGIGEVCFHIEVANIALPATLAHIHVGGAATFGPPVVTLTPPGSSGSSTGCVSANRDLVRDIMENPAGYYVNVHNSPFPNGAVRGQLTR